MEANDEVEQDGSLYFAYGSNLSSVQMRERCPMSTPLGLAHLSGWKWIINERGYANLVKDETPSERLREETEKTRGAYGIIYCLHSDDEASLDMDEGVPWAYERRFLEVILIEGLANTPVANINSKGNLVLHDYEKSRKKIQALAYIDFKRNRPGHPKYEYIRRMNRGIEDAMMQWRLPEQYVDSVIRPFIPA
ncbi:hypothetical protein K445DRAFT_20597 [Daldinia sp. EC12]|nr:hypothetical protein F4774DRAFT_396229 [Daldinia eschscholtzii]OTB17248.1 hypothetical protein K445DRAFT_20597 [Daldinia sp. EC12]